MGTLQNVLAALSGCNLKSQGRNEWRGNSPFRTGSDSNSFVLSASDDEHGTYFDHVENAGGSLYQLAERLGIPLPDRAPATDTKRGYTGLRDYAESHGAPIEAYERAKWTETIHSGRKALEFPTASGKRWRFIDGNKPPFIHEAGYTPCWYGLKTASDRAINAGLPLVLCNGEPSVVSAQWWGIPAACITSSGERGLKGKLLAELKEVWGMRRVIIALDCDDKGRKAADELSKQLQDEGFSTAIVDLGLTDKGDLADFCNLYRDGALEALIDRARFVVPTIEQRQLDAVTAIGANIQRLTTMLKQAKLSEKPVQQMIADLQSQLDAAKIGLPSNFVVSGGSVADRLTIRYQHNKENRGRMIGIPMGFPSVDRHTRGIRKGLSIFLGAQGNGKSTFLATITGNMVRMGYRGLILSTEMNDDDWSMRLQAYLMGVTTDQIEDGTLGDEYNDRHEMAMQWIEHGLDYLPREVSTVPMLTKAINDKRGQMDYDFVVIDSIKEFVGGSDNISMAYQTGMGELSDLAMSMSLPFLCSAHTKQEVNSREDHRPKINDAFGGVSIPSYAASFWTLYYPHYYAKRGMGKADLDYPEGVIELMNYKFRERGAIEGLKFPLRFIGGCGMYDIEKRTNVHN